MGHNIIGTLAQHFEKQGLEKRSFLSIKNIARNVLSKKLSLKIISEITGLSSEKSLKLKLASNKKAKKNISL